MKQFLYLDTDIVNSIIAQSENGIIMQQATEIENAKTSNKTVTGGVTGQVGAGGSILKLAKAEANLSANAGLSKDSMESLTKKEIITKTLHDAAFDIAIDEIGSTECENNEHTEKDIGKYVKINRKFDFVDLDYLENLFLEKGFISFLKKTSRESIEEETNAQVSANLTKNQAKAQRIEINAKKKELFKQIDKNYDDIHEIISIIKQIIPYSKFLLSNDGYIIPLENKYFRVDSSSIGFRYGGSINCVGMISNVLDENSNENSINVFSNLQITINKALFSIFPTDANNLCVIHPIGIFYE